MKRLLFIPLLLLCIAVYAQPAGYVPGTQVCWKINGYDHGYFKAAGKGERHILLAFTGYGEQSCANFQTNAPQNLLNDLGTNWNGRTVRAPGDTIVWEVLTIPNYAEFWMQPYARNIDSFFAKIAPVDTSEHWRFHVSGLSHGVGRFWAYLSNAQGTNSPYRHIFSTTISLSGQAQDAGMLAATSRNKRNWVWVGDQDYGQTHPGISQQLYNNLTGSKRFTLQASVPPASAGHNSITWDSCHSLRGTDTLTNTWLWMVARQQDTVTPQPCPVTGGPAGYVPGTQVSWTFNGRSHGYFRAAGCGERHILIVFTADTSTDSTNYQINAPQKLLQDAGINWNGRTARAPGDTIVWEVFTIPHTSAHWLQAYANDIDYFFTHIENIDTTDHNRFHMAGMANGVNRMWGYLTNDQSHNSPYRNIFSTTIGVSATWSSIYPKITAYSPGRRHWVWHGADDTNSTTPPSASVEHYNALNGNKRLTLQAGGGHNSITWDSCFSILGADSSNNRWIWMVTPPATLLQRSFAAETSAGAEKETALQAWPNPAGNTTRISWNGKPGTHYHLTIIDMKGSIRKSIPGINGNAYTLDMSQLEKGMYIIQVTGSGRRTQIKLMKE
ncbi:T9SS type A sorting domain-containing protein [Chitinophaga solisilvae]|uniref:T9SS type A sorting domain-containing protein n=1 Tax=Chitinophaga solisilvae TaxID=1233460 RepID=A0A3S1D1F8_9BACT|nr:T9SS type A sorting domain-containing protein [Chitinophaga solisilvae]NSL86288.1 T9SS type A sorting domain-containing protein [Chitinophaga solisilvae]